MGTFWSIVNALGPLAGLIAILSFATWVVSLGRRVKRLETLVDHSSESHKKEGR
jgi:hypothetical protein